jgi:hypothetical protein
MDTLMHIFVWKFYPIRSVRNVDTRQTIAAHYLMLVRITERMNSMSSPNPQLDRIKYVGAIALLARCSSKVNDELKECIERALMDACEDGTLTYYKTSDGGFDVESTWKAG